MVTNTIPKSACSALLREKGITKLYHFTDRDNLQSIVDNGGLHSWADCEDKGIKIAKPGGDMTSRDLDCRRNHQRYVRASFTRNHPMMYVAQKDGRITNPVILEISIDVVNLVDTLFSDRNAVKNGAQIGGAYSDLERVHWSVVKQPNHFNLDDDEKEFYQAEVLVKNFIPLSMITNIDSFGITCSNKTNTSENIQKETTKQSIKSNDLYSSFSIFARPYNITRLSKPQIEYNIIKSGNCGNNVKYELSDKGVLIISGNGEILENAFYGNELIKKVIIKDGITSIGKSAFNRCKSLGSIFIPNSVNCIEDAFFDCISLFEILINNNNNNFTLDKGILYNKDLSTLIYCPSKISNELITIPHTVNRIKKHAFSCCTSIKQIIILGDNTSIETCAFSFCTSLEKIILPKYLNIIESGLFLFCTSLKSIDIPNSVIQIQDTAFLNCKSLNSINLSHSLKNIGDSAFALCESLKTIILPNSLEHLGEEVFHRCESLKTISIPNSINVIKKGLFEYCENLESIIIPKSITKIEDFAFKDCISLEEIVIPNSVQSIGKCVFENCNLLTKITCLNSTPPKVMNDIYDNYEDCKLILPNGIEDLYKKHKIWGKFKISKKSNFIFGFLKNIFS